MQTRTTIVAVAAMLLAGGAAQAAITIDTVPGGNVGNAADTRYATPGYGAVSYEYNIGKYEVTAGQYATFLNAVAKTDTYGLYNSNMDSSSFGCQITQNGTSGNYTYDFSGGTVKAPGSTASDWANRPVNYVSYWDSCRFANWLHNGQPTGAQGAGTTETGAYTINGYNGDDGRTIQRSADAKWAVTSEDEWYKAAYYKGGGTNAGYWDYPTQSDSPPTAQLPTGTDMVNGSANYYQASENFLDPTYFTTEVGAYDAKHSDSAYGTFDQGGNVWEWNETIFFDNNYRGLRGGSFYYYIYGNHLFASDRHVATPTGAGYITGFRVASIPEPGSITMLVCGLVAGLIWWRRAK